MANQDDDLDARPPGIIWTLERFVVYAGCGFSNDGRDNDLLTLELGFTF